MYSPRVVLEWSDLLPMSRSIRPAARLDAAAAVLARLDQEVQECNVMACGMSSIRALLLQSAATGK
jgi:hypothetical protein